MRHLFYDRPVGRLPDELAQKAWAFGEQSLSNNEDELFTDAAGVAPGYPEAFATKAARDAALGSYAAHVEFIPRLGRNSRPRAGRPTKSRLGTASARTGSTRWPRRCSTPWRRR